MCTCVVCKTQAQDFPLFVLLEQVKTAATVPATSICHLPALPTILWFLPISLSALLSNQFNKLSARLFYRLGLLSHIRILQTFLWLYCLHPITGNHIYPRCNVHAEKQQQLPKIFSDRQNNSDFNLNGETNLHNECLKHELLFLTQPTFARLTFSHFCILVRKVTPTKASLKWKWPNICGTNIKILSDRRMEGGQCL